MTHARKILAVFAVAAGAAFILSTPVGARPLARNDRGGPDRGAPNCQPTPNGTPNAQPNSQCLQNCRQADRLCLESARVNQGLCAQSTCSSEQGAVQTACATDRASNACQSARSDLQTCLNDNCTPAFQTAVQTCLSARQRCPAACPSSQPDPQCVATCRTTSQICNLKARTSTALLSCFGNCNSLITTAEQACAIDPSGDDCTNDLRLAGACWQDCQQTEQSAEQSCQQAALSCIAACPSAATPTPTPGT